MNYKKIFDDSFSTLAPLTANEEIIRNVTERAEKMEKKKRISIKKPVIAVCAAVAAVAVGTISVGAATGWGYIDYFKNMFAQNYEGSVAVNTEIKEVPVQTTAEYQDISENTTASESTAQTTEKIEYMPEQPIGTFDFEKHGKALDLTMEGDGVTATVDGILVYDDMCYLMYTVEATDELLQKTNGEIPGLRIDFGHFGFRVDGKIAGGMGYSTGSLSVEGNKRTGFIEIEYDNVDMAGKTLNITFISEAYSDGNYTEILNQKQDIPVDFPVSETIERELGTAVKTETFDGTLLKARVSGFRTMLFFDGVTTVLMPDYSKLTPEQIKDEEYIKSIEPEKSAAESLRDELIPDEKAVVTLKDGTIVMAKTEQTHSTQEGSSITTEIELRYTYPVYPSDIESISFSDYSIAIE
ncbi:MAG: hypothetical protein J6A41_00830 [Ruminiclostridium sp.]|nr:hypothetical protein [Ruminiclostridium sp.]